MVIVGEALVLEMVIIQYVMPLRFLNTDHRRMRDSNLSFVLCLYGVLRSVSSGQWR